MRILTVLPNDTVRIADEQSLVIMDIVVELEDHSIANVEVQKIGYLFAGQRSACYSPRICCFGSIRGSKVRKGKLSVIKILKKYLQLFYMKKVLRNFGSIRKSTSIIFHRNPILESRWNYCREYVYIPLDVFGNLCK